MRTNEFRIFDRSKLFPSELGIFRGFPLVVSVLLFMVFLIFPFDGTSFGCDTYNHVWKTIFEEKSEEITPEMLRILLNFLEEEVSPISSGPWGITFGSSDPQKNLPEMLSEEVMRASGTFKYFSDFPVFQGEKSQWKGWEQGIAGMICLDIPSGKKRTYFWLDEVNINPQIFRRGEFQEVIFRFMAIDSRGEIQKIDEKKIFILQELDWLFPNFSFPSGLSLRRFGITRPGFPESREWIFAPLAIASEPNFVASNSVSYYLNSSGTFLKAP